MTRVVVLGMMSKMPVPGVAWQTLHYLEGLRRLGCDVWYVETHARTPSMFMEHGHDDGSGRAAGFIEEVLSPFGFGQRWAFHALHHDRRCYGMTERELDSLYGSADLLLNLHGGTVPLPALAETGRMVYLETDPVQLQIELKENREESVAFLEPHISFFTFAQNLGAPDCGLPEDPRFRFHATRQPVVLDWWSGRGEAGHRFTTIGNWRQEWREVHLDGETYHWSKHLEWPRFLSLPERTGSEFELALSGFDDSDRERLEGHGWRLREAMSMGLDEYRDFITGSAAEFTVAKDQNIRLRTGWFSDRSATYLAAGRPVVTQDTGFDGALPTGEGLFAVSTLGEAVAAVESIASDPRRHQRAAVEIAREYFSHEAVLAPLLSEAGASLGSGGSASTLGPAGGLADELSLEVVSRRPTVLEPATRAAALYSPLPTSLAATDAPRATIVVVCHDGLAFTRLCLASVIEWSGEDIELVVVDNGSGDGTTSYLEALAASSPGVRVLRNERNEGLPAAANKGLAAARGANLVLLNNDTVVVPGWLDPLMSALGEEGIGMCGPVTNRIGTEAEVECDYITLGDLRVWAGGRAAAHLGETRDVEMAAMFCVALRRETYERIGPLDELFGVGLLEDDDYAERLRAAGLRITCVEDSFVHHFGEASFGALVPTGQHDRLLRENRRRFRDKHGKSWRPYERRLGAHYSEVTDRIRAVVEKEVPAEATVLVVSRGDERLLELAGRRTWHFPQDDDGVYAGHHPGNSAEAITHLEKLRERGGDFILFPETGMWWLGHYGEFAEHLNRSGRPVVFEPDTCVIYALGEESA